jgi:propionyl-CoA carboxylase beta chain
MSSTKTHQSELERLETLEKRAEMGGGKNSIDRHHGRGKLTARERLELLFDPESFVEVNKLAESQSADFGMQERKVTGDGVVTGYGTIDGRMVFAYAQDVTVLGGSVICLCSGCYRAGWLGGNHPRSKNLSHHG